MGRKGESTFTDEKGKPVNEIVNVTADGKPIPASTQARVNKALAETLKSELAKESHTVGAKGSTHPEIEVGSIHGQLHGAIGTKSAE